MPQELRVISVKNVLVSTDWLAEHLYDPNLRIADCRFSFDHDAASDYGQGHLPGAVHVRLQQDLASPDGPIHFALPEPERFAASMGRLGIGDETLVVAYDDEGDHFASRLWLCLTFYGHERIRLLDGGLTKWRAEGRPIDIAVPRPRPAVFTPRAAAPGLRSTAEDVRSAIDRPGTVLLDVRREGEYLGTELRAARGGHIPGAVHALWQENVDWSGERTFKPAAAIAERYRALGITPEQQVITYCQGGVRAAHSALALLMAGYQDVSVYDGSWDDWGNRQDLPIERG
jgi:thiosulfate/3-mercaptopyruvate sulfurtransferase